MEIRVDTAIKAVSGTTTTITDDIVTAAGTELLTVTRIMDNIAVRRSEIADIVWQGVIIGVTGSV